MSTGNDDLWGLIRKLQSGTDIEQRFANNRLIAQAEEAVPLLIQEMEEELQRGKESQRLTGHEFQFDKALNRLAMLLARLGDARAIPILARFAQSDPQLTTYFFEPLNYLLIKLVTTATRNNVEVLLWLLRASSRAQQLQVLRVIVALAERDPIPELYQALSLVRPRFGEWEKAQLCRRLKKALLTKSLPIPAMNTQTTEDLPLPADEKI